jgi:hypothetical protein
MTENFVRLTIDEMEVLMDSLQLIDTGNEYITHNRTGISLPSLYNKLYSSVEEIKASQ